VHFLLLSNYTQAQTPYHYLLGSEELEGIDIYDIIQNKNGEFIASTDNGLYQYNGYEFKIIEHTSNFSKSTFNLITSSCKDSVSILYFFDETPNFKIIFVTVYNQYTVKDFELSAVDCLVKPADISRLKSAVEEASIYISQKELIDKYEVITNGWTVTL
jgi:hypothetical protein